MEPLVVSHTYQTSPDKVWDALTKPAEMKIWYFSVQNFVLEEKAVFTFYEVETGGSFLHSCKILNIVPLQIFEHTWEHPSHSKGKSVVKWEISAKNEEETTVTLTHTGIENFADAGPAFLPENFLMGWNHILKVSLRNYLHGIEKLVFEIDINAPREKVWQVLWGKETYGEWTKAFIDGSYFEGEIEQGKRVHLLSPSGEGMYSDVVVLKENEQLIFSHIGYLKDKKELPLDKDMEAWTGSQEGYELTETPSGTHLRLELDNQKEFHDEMNKKFPLALRDLKRIAEA
ncbi:SRPBCC domain-containing protein [Dyadobacter sp. CY312]|uniref:SRPBCC family protein n=1 Tax=Dyadobacter sp. CY312 TaxID=2907303 RepID=UPI001F3FE0A6|nr:SRPBCC domain-containing protein [Dyadobacter sp. CY312]MCE7040244.1 SRPBCC domain-containing protein [Dyadobacter sp. CY312]